LAIFNNIPSDGINRGLIKHLSNTKTNSLNHNSIFNISVWFTIIHFIIISLYFLVDKNNFDVLIEATGVQLNISHTLLLIIILLLGQIGLLLHSLINSTQNTKKHSLIGILSNVAGVIVLLLSFRWGSLTHGLIAIALGQSFYFVFSIIIEYNLVISYLKNLKTKFDTDSAKKIGEFVFMAISTLVFGKIVDLYVREYSISQFSLIETGYWQAIVKLSDSYTMIFTATVAAVYFPKISSLVNTPFELKKYVKPIFYKTTLLVIIGLVFVFLLKDFIIEILFTSEFKKANYLIKYQLAGDVLKLSSWILAFIMSAQAKTKIFIASQAFSALLYLILLYFLIPAFGLEGLTIAHFIRFIGYFAFVVIMYRKLIY
jgi:polysaccharide transporter, PST family